jgi:hypothetical protein
VLCAGSGGAGLQALEQIGARGGEVALVVVHVQPFALAPVVPGFGWTAAAAIHGHLLAGEAARRGGA